MVNGFTPLFAACENNDLDVAKILVEAGADTNAKSRDGPPPPPARTHTRAGAAYRPFSALTA